MGNPAHTATQGVNLRIHRRAQAATHRADQAAYLASLAAKHACARRRGQRRQRTPATHKPQTHVDKDPRPRHTFTGEANAGNEAATH